MTIFYCEDRLDAMMTCIYYAWASKLGYKNIYLKAGTVMQRELFCEYRYITAEEDKAESVIRSIQRKISYRAYYEVYKTAMSKDPDKLNWIYLFLLLGFAYGKETLKMLKEPPVETVMRLGKKVGNEAHLYREFTRFHRIPPGIYISHFEPDNNIITFLAEYFEDRMPSEQWIIVDDRRKLAAIHPKEREYYLSTLTQQQFETLKESEKVKDGFTDLWKTFFHTIGIKERENPACQKNMMPLKYRRHVTEFRD